MVSYELPAGARTVLRRRLTRQELQGSLEALVRGAGGLLADLPLDARVFGYENNPDALGVSSAHVALYASAAEGAGALLPGDLCVGSSSACLQGFIDRYGRRVHRRPLSVEERADYLALATAAGGSGGPAVRAAFTAMLQSPQWLYQVEVALPDPARPGRARLDPWSLAARLAFLLWGVAPDDALLDQAAAGALDSPDGVGRVAAAMLRDGRARAGVGRFAREWLRLYSVAWLQRDSTRYPVWRRIANVEALAEETGRFADDVLWRDGADLRDLLTARYTFMDRNVAVLYGRPPPAAAWGRVDFDASEGRAGVLTQPSVLAVTSRSNRESATLRGEYVRSVLLCDEIEPPPIAVAGQAGAFFDERTRTAQHAADPACAGCHAQLDPVGFGFERYDAVGSLLPEAAGRSGAGSVAGLAPPDFVGPVELGQRIRESGLFERCAVRQLFRYAFGRREDEVDDGATLLALERSLPPSGYDVRALILALVRSDAFQTIPLDEAMP